MKKKLKTKIKKIVKESFKKKIEGHKSESEYSPFQDNLLGKYRQVGSFVHSVATSVGMSMFEQITTEIAEELGGFTASRQHKLSGSIDSKTEKKISEILNSEKFDYLKDIKKIKTSTQKIAGDGSDYIYQHRTVDIFLKKGNKEYYIDITSPKNNKKEFHALKEKLLRWTALRHSTDKNIEVFPSLAFPFNPYHPEDYSRFSLSDLFDTNEEIRIQENFWNWIAGGEEVYDDLIEVFKETGEELSDELETKINSILLANSYEANFSKLFLKFLPWIP